MLPASFTDNLQNLPGFDKEAFEKIHRYPSQVTSIRLNSFKWNKYAADKSLPDYLPVSSQVPWCENGYYLSERPSFIYDPLWHGGAYYVQEAASMFIAQILQQHIDLSQPLKLLDLCAAPGGKSTLLQSMISKESLLISNEIIGHRNNILRENLIKWGADNIVVTQNDAAHFQRLPGYFDIILIDAPCSGSGMFRKNPEAVKEWSEQNVALCSQRQQRILADVWPALKENGILIYTTCSYSKEENEDILDWLADNFKIESIPITFKDDWHIIPSRSSLHHAIGYRFYPYLLQGEGLFAACICKRETTREISFKKNKPAIIAEKAITQFQPWIAFSPIDALLEINHEIYLFPKKWCEDISFLQKNLRVRQLGINMGKLNAHHLIPSHQLALSNKIKGDIPSLHTDKDNALKYLKREEINMTIHQQGWHLIRYKNFPLGWVKILPNRINNYFPLNQRILQNVRAIDSAI